MAVRIENTKPIHIDLICNNLREEDKQEYYHTVGIPKNDHYVNCCLLYTSPSPRDS